MRGKKQLALVALIAYGVLATVLVFNFLNSRSQNTAKDHEQTENFKEALDIMLRANEAQCFDVFIEDLSAKVFESDMLKQRKIGELVRCLQKNYAKLQKFLAKDFEESSKENAIELKFLPIYSANTYVTPVEVDWYDYEDYDAYKKTMTDELTLSVWAKAFDKEAHKRLMRLFRILTELFYRQKMEYILTEGSLMGSLRHFDQIPWDDDADILVDAQDVDKFVSVITNQTEFPDLRWIKSSRFKYKLFLSSGIKAGRYNWTYPFIDVFFYQQNLTHIYRKFRNVLVYTLKTDVFPLKLRPFGKYWLPTAKNPLNYLKPLNYSNFHDTCIRGGWNHRKETRQKAYRANCSIIREHFQFTSRNCLPKESVNICTEVVEMKGKGFVYLLYNNSQPITLKIGF